MDLSRRIFCSWPLLHGALLASALAGTACADRPVGEPRLADASVGDRLDDVMVWERDVTLEESEETINVTVRAAIDPHGGFLIADEREGFARRYDRDGRLLAQFGGKGPGPNEFPNLLSILRLPDGTLAAFDIFNRISFFDPAGEQLLRTTRTPVGPVHSVLLLNDSVAILGGHAAAGGGADGARLHLWNLNADSILASFFSPPLASEAHVLADNTTGWASVDRLGDTLAVVSALSDTVYLTSTSGERYAQISIPARGYRLLDPRLRRPDPKGGTQEIRRWLGSFSLNSDVFWLGGTFIVQYQDRTGPQPKWRFVVFGRDGRRKYEVIDSPKLLMVDRASGLLYFVAPESPTPNVWRVGRLAERQ